MSGMAEVILRTSVLDLQSSLALARELEAAGFGPVKEVAAKALEDAADAIEPSWFQYHGGSKDMNEGKRTWLRARAAAVRGAS